MEATSELEQLNQDLMMKLYVAKQSMEQANLRIEELEKRNAAYEKFHMTFYETRAQLTDAFERIDNQQSKIVRLQQLNSDLLEENLALKNPNYHDESPTRKIYPNPIERPKSVPSPCNNSKAPSTPQRPVTSTNDIELKHDQAKKIKTSTIADKLKLSLAQTSPERIPSPKKRVAQPTTPRVVVKEVATPIKKAATNNKSLSLMVTKLWKGLTRDDILEYFGKFGKIVNDQMPDAAKELPDGSKYLFLKFLDSASVDKALENNGNHTIKGLYLVVKRGTHTL